MQLSVVIPARNEADNIVPLVDEVEAALAGRFDFEVLVVDDGSTDTTYDQLKASRPRLPRLRVVRHAANCGQSAGVWTGVKRARGEWIATLDGDGQNDPADLPAMWARLEAEPHPDMVAGHRVDRKDTASKRIASRLANRVRAGFLKDETPDSGCGIKIFRRDLFLELPYFDHMHRFLPALVRRHGGRVVSVPVNHRPRGAGRSNYTNLGRLRAGLLDLIGVWWLIRRSRLPIDATEET
ncbi:MAG: glycosyltransferase family 2 protein [Alphaproteobacteria bacterium]|nr:glycosyltransferase family 2 protein [Alphaproteobacteria bacterium]